MGGKKGMGKKIMEFVLGIITIYGMFFTKFYITKETDDSYNLFGETYNIKGGANVELKDQLSFWDGLNNGIALLGQLVKSVFIGSWEIFMSLNDLITMLSIDFLWKVILYILLIILSIALAMFLMIILFSVVAFKLVFFKATVSYYLGFFLMLIIVWVISTMIDRIEVKEKSSNRVVDDNLSE